jgi:SH3-like domain-containing protein
VNDGVYRMAMKKARVRANYTSSSLDPLFIMKGESVVVTYESEEWPGWIWCINKDGKSGWAPMSYLEITGESAVAKRDYDATELTVRAGDELTVLDEESGWCRCSFGEDEKGWVPSENLEFSG